MTQPQAEFLDLYRAGLKTAADLMKVSLQNAEKLLQAAQMLAQKTEAMQLRYLQTLTQIAGDKASTIVFPVPMDVLTPLLGTKKTA